MSRGQTLSAELWCPKQRCSDRSTWYLSFCQSLHHRFSLSDTFALCTDAQGVYLPSEASFSVLPSHCVASLLVCSVFQPAVNKEFEGGSLYVLQMV